MPWKEPGKGDKDPWKSGNQQPPDLEEVFRTVNNRIGQHRLSVLALEVMDHAEIAIGSRRRLDIE